MEDDPRAESSSSSRRRNTKQNANDFIEQLMLGDVDLNEGIEDEEGLDEFGMDQDQDLEDEDWPEDIVDDEITNMLNNTKASRELLKTGGLEEMVQDLDFEHFEDNLLATRDVGKAGKKARRRVAAGEARVPADAKNMLGRANALYAAQDYGQTIDLLQALITKYPTLHQAWNTLGLVHEDMGNKEKSLQLRMVAAHSLNDVELWKELGAKSIENGAVEQAIYCLDKVVNLDPADVDALWDRSFLYKKLKRTDHAIEGFKEILEIYPHHFKVINELAQLYRIKGQTKEAIKLYEDATEYHIYKKNEEEDNEEEEDDDDAGDTLKDKLGYTEINMLSELYLMQNDYGRALDCIKSGIRHVQHREDETSWLDHTDDDDEYFEKDENDTLAVERCDFPIELRVRMGICRLYLGQVRLARRHFEYLLQYPPTAYPDLQQDIAYAYMDKRHYELALSVFQRVVDASDEVEVDFLIRTADCYHQVGELESAALFYVNVLEEQPNNLDVMLMLANVYEEQGKEDQALELVDFVMKKSRESRGETPRDSQSLLSGREESSIAPGSGASRTASLFPEKHQQTATDQRRQIKEQRMREDEERGRVARANFEKIFELERLMGPDILTCDRQLTRDYMRVAQELWNDFSQVRAFYPSIRAQRFEGFYALRRGVGRSKPSSLDIEAHQLATRLRGRVKREPHVGANLGEEQQQKDEEQQAQMSAASQYRGASFDDWLRVFITYAYMLTTTRRAEEAYELLRRVGEANVFYHDIPKKTSIKLALLGCGLIQRNDVIVNEMSRWLCSFYQFRNDPYRIYGAAMASGGTDKTARYASSITLRFLMRNIRLMDAMVAQQKKRSERQEQQDGDEAADTRSEAIHELNRAILAMTHEVDFVNEQNYSRFYYTPEHMKGKVVKMMGIRAPKQVNPLLLNLFGQVMSIGKNYIAAAMFFMRAYALAPKEPLNTLSLSISMFQRAMQRKTDNRHVQIMQGMMFLFEYYELRHRSQEAEYNVARGFHLLGLTHLAVPHYERVLVLPSANKMGKVLEKSIEDVYRWPVDDLEEASDDEEDESDLKREAAYNLHLIYVTSGSTSLAQVLLQKYCTI